MRRPFTPILLSMAATVLAACATTGLAQDPEAEFALPKNVIKVSYSGSLSTDMTKTVSGYFIYDQSKPVDFLTPGQFTFTKNAHYQHGFNCTGNVSQPSIPANAKFIVYTNVDAAYKKVQVSTKDNTTGNAFDLTLNTPDALLNQAVLADRAQYPVPSNGAIPGTGTMTVTNGGSTSTYNISVTGSVTLP